MEELRKCYAELSARLRSIENDHETDILDFINLDEEIMNDFRGDWTYEYDFVERTKETQRT